MRILHVIESLEFGGAEKVVVTLANSMARSHEVSVCCVKRIGELARELDPAIHVHCREAGEGNDYRLPFRFTGKIDRVAVRIGEAPLTPEEKRDFDAIRGRAVMAE